MMLQEKKMLSFHKLFAALDKKDEDYEYSIAISKNKNTTKNAIERHMGGFQTIENMNGIKRIQLCRQGLEALDRRGWNRSFHQRMFHEEYLKSCTRVFFKRDGPGAFSRSHSRVLEVNGWDSTPQEILVSTPRRFGKTISVSMFAAAMIFSCPNMELSIYSTCKRISQKLLRNIVKFLELIFLELNVMPYKFLRINQEEVHVAGNEGQGDVRVINSYPSKIVMRLANIYIEATSKGILPSESVLQGLWEKWLWGADCNAMIDETCGDMNQMHILGILLALLESVMFLRRDAAQPDILLEDLLPDIPLIHLYKKPISLYSLRELTDQVECLQLSWGQVLCHGDFESCYTVLKKLFSRFGCIIHYAYPKTTDSDLDDPQYITLIPSSSDNEEEGGYFITTRKYIRQMVCIFLALFRSIYIISSSEIVPEISEDTHNMIKTAFKIHHIESSIDLFNHLQQVICLAPGMRLVYRTNFAGMYNDISQVVYFHHPKFTKQSQLKLKDILQNSINTLPLLSQLFPQILVYYEDDSVIPFLTAQANGLKYDTEAPVDNNNKTMDEETNIDDFVRKRIEEENEAALKHKINKSNNPKKEIVKNDGEHFSWLVCCSSVFLVDTKKKKILSSYNASLLPLIAYMMEDDEATIGVTLKEGFTEAMMDPHSLMLNNKGVKIDLGTAHGHVCLF